jgi:Fe-S cluster biogenesis protein NfuA
MSDQKIPVSVYAEMTPNPAVLKFVANKRLIDEDSVELRNIEEASVSPLATRLFHYPFVKEVFISGNYIAVTKYDIIEWEEVSLEVRELVRDYIASGQPVLTAPVAVEQSEKKNAALREEFPDLKDPSEWEEIEKKIASILDEYVKPAVEQDGGNIKFLQLEGDTVKVLLQGACSGCPSSTQTLRQGIQNLLDQMLPGQIKSVEAVNG